MKRLEISIFISPCPVPQMDIILSIKQQIKLERPYKVNHDTYKKFIVKFTSARPWKMHVF